MTEGKMDLAALDRLQAQYSLALDSQDMQGWLNLFSEDAAASYICTTRQNIENGHPLALMLDDCRARLEDRLTYVTRVWAGTFQRYYTRHLTQRLEVTEFEGGALRMLTAMVVYYTAEEDGVSKVLVTGLYDDVVDLTHAEPKFLAKKAILDTSVMPRYLVYPL
jgi:3-phenylpropionate/cinnamic acid dioxygenase small subunit